MNRRFPGMRRGARSSTYSLDQAILGLGLDAWFRADRMSGDDFVDRIDPAHKFVASTPLTVATDAQMGGRATATFSGTQYCTSNKADSWWLPLHSGAGGCVWVALYDNHSLAVAVNPILANRANGAASAGYFFGTGTTGGTTPIWRMQIHSGTASVVSSTGGYTQGATYLRFRFQNGLAPAEWSVKERSTGNVGSGNKANAPSATVASNPMRLFADGPATTIGVGRWAETLVLFGTPTDEQESLVQRYFLARYGIV